MAVSMNRKALFFDIDGTLLTDSTKELPPSAAAAIQKARAAGHVVFINSGRTRCLMQEVEQAIEMDGYLCGCGTYIEISGQVALHHQIASGRRLELQRAILRHRLEGILEGVAGCYGLNETARMPEVEHVKGIAAAKNVLISCEWSETAAAFDKFCVVYDEQSDLPGFLRALGPDIVPIDRGGRLYECVPFGFDKASAMQFVLERLGIPWEESYAFGDSTNDLAMIKYACHSVVMGHHSKELDPYASFVTKNVEDDGIAYAMEALCII